MILSVFRSEIKKILILSLIAGIVLLTAGTLIIEPSLAQAVTTNVVVTLNVTQGISISVDAATKSLSTNLGVATNVAVGTSTFTVITNDPLGYTLGLNASTNPAMVSGGNNVSDYATTSMPSLWSVSSAAKFGFSVFGTDVNTTTWGTGSFCNGAATSTVSASLKYYGFYTNPTTTASRAATTTPTGINTTVCYAVEQNNVFIPAGTYTATITGTATAL